MSVNKTVDGSELNVKEIFSVQGKVALVTGGSRGIGMMIARGLVANGARVFITARSQSDCDITAAALTRMGPGTCVSLPCDLTSDAACRDLATKVEQHSDRLHILVNNAGASWGEDFGTFPEAAWAKILNLNVVSVFNLTRACLPLLKAGRAPGQEPASPPTVINIGSVMGHSTDPEENTYSYSASKAAVAQLTRTLAAQFAPMGITVNCIAPGIFPSKMTKFMLGPEEKAPPQIVAKHPLGRIGRESDMAGLVLFLSSVAGAFVTGAVIPLDGGYTVFRPPSSKL
mmetsp:Transcript_15619/g.21590  ORF Transcript_15619/g.21590 Transcript_15619/m.21590 type:complete len:286 (-) Transcript_15619:112-969(-)|eukprot:CAMPEP_0196593078 /NCGR_PEP_ID=MMETSP1081-20130531/74617_1 /TAXON_ID=36882 /ORGANISM="Pyramimonas amylifera, Strain CCMP720" /LENGTH=285 /DNA_ID=CAMNT_0041916951 /DNA_START=90 /DNA_END=947 /DNA_ORIENTATION=-